MSALPFRAIPQVQAFRPQIVMFDDEQAEHKPVRSRYLDEHGRLTCPTCGCHDFKTPDSEPWGNGCKIKKKKCRHCGLRVRTREVVDDE